MFRFVLIATFMVGVYSQCKAKHETPCGPDRKKIADLGNKVPQEDNGIDTFLCKYSGEKITSSSKCNCIVDCYDRSDESEDTCGVDYNKEDMMGTMVQERVKEMGCSVCSLSHDIVYNKWICDGIVDCLDRSDESYELCVEIPKHHHKNLTTPFPWAVSLNLKNKHWCGGTIINHKWILTAAHCVEDVSAKNLQIIAGEYNRTHISGTEKHFDVEESIIHENYSLILSVTDDIALIKIRGSIKYNDFIEPMDLPPPGKEFTGNASLAGWGSRWYRGNARQVMREMSLPLVDRAECAEIYEYGYDEIYTTHICAGDRKPGTGVCFGDSGSGLICKDRTNHKYVCGIASFIGDNKCQGSAHPDVFTKVSKYINWINMVIKKFS